METVTSSPEFALRCMIRLAWTVRKDRRAAVAKFGEFSPVVARYDGQLSGLHSALSLLTEGCTRVELPECTPL